MIIVTIQNDGTGTDGVGNYDVTVLINRDVVWRGRVEQFLRQSGWEELIARVGEIFRESKSETE